MVSAAPNSWIRTTAILAICACLLGSSPSQAAGDAELSVIGKWKLTRARDAAAITSLDEREAQRLVGKVLSIEKNRVKLGSHVCGPSDFEAQLVDVRLFVRQEFRASSVRLGLPDPAVVVDLSCTTVFIKNPRKLLIFWDGWFFDAVRIP